MFFELGAGHGTGLYQDLAQPAIGRGGLASDRLLELLGCDSAVPNEHISEAIAPVHDRGERDLSFVEVDRPEVLPVGEREAAGAPPHVQELDDVGETGFFEAALDRHQAHSSISRSGHHAAAARRQPDAALRPSTGAGNGGLPLQRFARTRRRRRDTAGLCGVQHLPDETLHRAHRVGRPRGEVRGEIGVDGAELGVQFPFDDALPHLLVGSRDLDDEPAFEPGSEPRLQSDGVGQRHGRREDHLAARFGEDVEEQEQLVLGTLLVGDQMNVVEEQRRGPAVAGTPGPDGVAVDGLDELAGEFGGVETGHRSTYPRG